MGQLAIVTDPDTGEFFRKPGRIAPQSYSVVVRYTPDSNDVYGPDVFPEGYKDYELSGIDFRKADTAEEALEEAKFKLKIKPRDSVYTPEQIAARDQYTRWAGYLGHAINLVEMGVFVENTPGDGDDADGLDLGARRELMKQKAIDCFQLGVTFIGVLP